MRSLQHNITAMDRDIEQDLWLLYLETKDPSIRNDFTVKYRYLVNHCATKIWKRIASSATHLEWEDLHGYGMLGLIDAVEHYSPHKQARFITYAHSRITGTIIDWMRRTDSVPRNVRTRYKQIESFSFQWEMLNSGQTPDEPTIALHLDLTPQQIQECRLAVERSRSTVSLETIVEMDQPGQETEFKDFIADQGLTPEQRLMELDLRVQLHTAIANALTDQEQKVVIAMYLQNEEGLVPLLAKQWGLSESRLYQMHSKAMGKLRQHLGEQFYKQQVAA